ncbi:trk system potassium uptake protein TrkA [Lachnospiraceae bacterium XBB2008]|nr:trk system potassium uptake protein TrkA [Lachnospiraceae bacterium XBB2008]
MSLLKADNANGLKIIIVGCGKVGATLVAQLIKEGHDISVIDTDSARIQEITNLYDVMGVIGNGASFTVQKDAGIDDADLLIAITGSDELNMLCCTVAKRVGDCAAIARVRTPDYSQEVGYLREKLGLALIINPELETAVEAANILSMPSAMEVDSFARGQAQLIKFKIDENNILNGKAIMELDHKHTESILISAVQRDGEVTIPSGTFRLQAGDILSVLGTRKSVRKFMDYIGMRSHAVRTAMIVGGGRAAYYLGLQLTNMGVEVKIIERDQARCEELSILLPKAIIIHADGSDEEILREEGIVNTDAFIPLTGIDEQNIMLTLYAKSVTQAKIVTKITRIGFSGVISGLDLDSVIYPNKITAEAIIAYVRAMRNSQGYSNIETLYHLFDHKAEALEFKVGEANAATDKPLSELKLKKNLLVTCIIRNGRIIIPRGGDSILKGDSVVVITTDTGFKDITDILA